MVHLHIVRAGTVATCAQGLEREHNRRFQMSESLVGKTLYNCTGQVAGVIKSIENATITLEKDLGLGKEWQARRLLPQFADEGRITTNAELAQKWNNLYLGLQHGEWRESLQREV
jgi:hypothetical protein